MCKNYRKVARRNLLIRKVFTGLGIGSTYAGLNLLWVENEMNDDTVFPRQDLAYYVPTNQIFEGETYTFYSTPGPLAKDLKEEIPEITKDGQTGNWFEGRIKNSYK